MDAVKRLCLKKVIELPLGRAGGFGGSGLDQDKNYDKLIVTGAGPLIEWMQAGAATLCF